VTETARTEKLTAKTKVLYGIADLGAAMVTSSINFFLLFFYTDVLYIDPGLAGMALLTGKLTWDAINDPLMGYLSDRTRTRIGRRRPYMLAGAIPLGLATWYLYSIPGELSGVVAFLTIVGSFLLFDTMYTMIHVPYVSLTPELTHDYEERTALTTVRMIFSSLGYILGAASTTAIAGWFQGLGWTEKASYSGVGAVFGVIATTVVLTTALSIRERRAEVEPSTMPPVRALLQSFRNKPFVRLVAAFFCNSVAFALLTSLLPYLLTYQMDMSKQIPVIMLSMLLMITAFLYVYKWLSDKINKGPAYALGLGMACVAVVTTFFLPQGPSPLIYVIAAVAGMGFSANFVCPWSMLPDVIEYDELETGERREGVYYGMWAFCAKLADALGIAISGWSLSLFGYVPDVAQSARALLGIRLFFGIVPVVLILIGLPLLIWYPITRDSHAKVRAQLGARVGLEPAAE
jgi:GPH family glycoside/pentoside/hexuronide:cation symporter